MAKKSIPSELTADPYENTGRSEPGFYEDAFDGSTAIGGAKGNRATEHEVPSHIQQPHPFGPFRKGNR